MFAADGRGVNQKVLVKVARASRRENAESDDC